MNYDYDAGVEVGLSEDLTYSDAAPLLDAFAETPVFTVRSHRSAWSGPMGEGVIAAMEIVAVLGAAAFAKAFFGELGKDAYAGVRAAVRAVAQQLRERAGDEARADVVLMLQVGALRFYVGNLRQPPEEEEWTDGWLRTRLARAHAVVAAAPGVLVSQSLEALTLPRDSNEGWDSYTVHHSGYYWDADAADWRPDYGMQMLLEWASRAADS